MLVVITITIMNNHHLREFNSPVSFGWENQLTTLPSLLDHHYGYTGGNMDQYGGFLKILGNLHIDQ